MAKIRHNACFAYNFLDYVIALQRVAYHSSLCEHELFHRDRVVSPVPVPNSSERALAWNVVSEMLSIIVMRHWLRLGKSWELEKIDEAVVKLTKKRTGAENVERDERKSSER
jgi:hypothetical protein